LIDARAWIDDNLVLVSLDLAGVVVLYRAVTPFLHGRPAYFAYWMKFGMRKNCTGTCITSRYVAILCFGTLFMVYIVLLMRTIQDSQHLGLNLPNNTRTTYYIHPRASTVPFRPGVQSLVTINFELNTTYVLSRVTGHIEQCTKEIAKIYQKYLLQ